MPGRTCAIAVEGIEVFAYHGVLPEEKERGQRFLIDVRLELAGVPDRDELEDTVDYARVAGDAARLAADTRFDLVETLAGTIADHIVGAARFRNGLQAGRADARAGRWRPGDRERRQARR